jgi:hypothetical protein
MIILANKIDFDITRGKNFKQRFLSNSSAKHLVLIMYFSLIYPNLLLINKIIKKEFLAISIFPP